MAATLSETGEHLYGNGAVGTSLDERGRTLIALATFNRGLLDDGVFVFDTNNLTTGAAAQNFGRPTGLNNRPTYPTIIW